MRPGGSDPTHQGLDEAPAGAGRRVAAVAEGVHAARHLAARRRRQQLFEVVDVAVHAAVRDQAQQVQGAAALVQRDEELADGQVLLGARLGEGVPDAHETLLDDAPRAQGHVPDFRVAHLARGQADRLARGLDARAGV